MHFPSQNPELFSALVEPIKRPDAPSMVEPSPTAQGKEPALSDPERWVDEHGDDLFKFALARLRDPVKAEDFVQEAFLAALRGGSNFSGRSSERTWLTGILKNKIFDHFRKVGRETSFTDMEFYQDEESDGSVPDRAFKDTWIYVRPKAGWCPS